MGKRSIDSDKSSNKKLKLDKLQESKLFDEGLGFSEEKIKKKRKKSSEKSPETLRKRKLKADTPKSPSGNKIAQSSSSNIVHSTSNATLAPSPCDSGVSSVGNSPISSFIKSPIPHPNSIQKDVGIDCKDSNEDPRSKKCKIKDGTENIIKIKIDNGTLSRSKLREPPAATSKAYLKTRDSIFTSLLLKLPEFSFSEQTSDRFRRTRQLIKHQNSCETDPLFASYTLNSDEDQKENLLDTNNIAESTTNSTRNTSIKGCNFLSSSEQKQKKQSSNFKLPTDYRNSKAKMDQAWKNAKF